MPDNPQPRLCWEDIATGKAQTYGAYPVSKEDIIAWGVEFDPQPHHVDEAAALLNPLTKGLCASGWHTCAMFMRMFFDGVLRDSSCIGGPSVTEVRWMKPVRPGWTMKMRTVATEKRLSRTRPGVGICTFKHDILNQDDEVVMTLEGPVFFGVRDPAAAARSSTTETPR